MRAKTAAKRKFHEALWRSTLAANENCREFSQFRKTSGDCGAFFISEFQLSAFSLSALSTPPFSSPFEPLLFLSMHINPKSKFLAINKLLPLTCTRNEMKDTKFYPLIKK